MKLRIRSYAPGNVTIASGSARALPPWPRPPLAATATMISASNPASSPKVTYVAGRRASLRSPDARVASAHLRRGRSLRKTGERPVRIDRQRVMGEAQEQLFEIVAGFEARRVDR